ncbi:MAG: hypothetical protein NVS3B26_19390 [Mycobacteriales bacterium]
MGELHAMSALPCEPRGFRGVPTPHRRRRWLRRPAALATVLLIVPAAIAVLWPLTPSVADTEHRIAVQLARHGDRDPHAVASPDRVGVAIIATEDSRFYGHHGLDLFGVARAAVSVLTGSGHDAGGATLDQQLMKNLYMPTGPLASVEQIELSFKLEAAYSKAQILEMYLSAIYFGHGFYGLPAAAHGYFGVTPRRLSWSQASLLAGLVQAPTAYDPYRHPALARQRQEHVVGRLVATHVLTPAAAEAVLAAPWRLV